MSKITFNIGEKQKIIQCINDEGWINIDIELIKKKYTIIKILHQYTNIISPLINIIFEYTHEIILVNFSNGLSVIYTIELKDQFKIELLKEYNKHYSVCMYKNYYNTLFNYKTIKLCKNDTIKPIHIINGKLWNTIYRIYSLSHFIDYYMPKYYNKSSQYIKNLRYPDVNYYGIYQNTYYQVCDEDSKYIYFHVMQMLDHRKIKQMIIIVKLFVDLLSKN